MHSYASDFDRFLIKVDDEITGDDDGLGMALRAADDRLNAGNKLILVERLGQIIIGPKSQSLDLVLDRAQSRKDKDRGLDLGNPQGAQHLIARDVRKVQIEQYDVVVVELADFRAILPEVRRIDVKIFGFQHQFNALRRRAIVFNQ